jgi:hypothetical protein
VRGLAVSGRLTQSKELNLTRRETSLGVGIAGTSILDISNILSDSRGHLGELLHITVVLHDGSTKHRREVKKENFYEEAPGKGRKDFDEEKQQKRNATTTLIYLSKNFTFHNFYNEPLSGLTPQQPSASIANYQVTKSS